MSVWAVFRVKDEQDVIRETVGHMMTQVDHVLVADNGSTDGTLDILHDLGCEVVEDPEVAYRQSERCSALAESAREQGAEWIISADADEVWSSRDERRIADALADVPANIPVVEAELFDHVSTSKDDLALPPVERMQWRRRYPLPLPKVAFRAIVGTTVHYGNHGVTFPAIDVPLRLGGLLEVRHFPYRSVAQTISKIRNGAAAYAAGPDISEDHGGHWRGWGRILEAEGEQAIADLYLKWHFRRRPLKEHWIDDELQSPLIHDPVPLWVPSLS